MDLVWISLALVPARRCESCLTAGSRRGSPHTEIVVVVIGVIMPGVGCGWVYPPRNWVLSCPTGTSTLGTVAVVHWFLHAFLESCLTAGSRRGSPYRNCSSCRWIYYAWGRRWLGCTRPGIGSCPVPRGLRPFPFLGHQLPRQRVSSYSVWSLVLSAHPPAAPLWAFT